MDEKTFKEKTKKLVIAIIKQVDKLPRSRASIASIKTLRNRPQSKIVNPKS